MADRFHSLARGFVVARAGTVPSGREHTSWWYGPDHGWGTTSGPLDRSVALFASRAGARLAIQQAGVGGRGYRIIPVDAAIELELDEARSHVEWVLREDRPDRPDWTSIVDSCLDRVAVLERWAAARITGAPTVSPPGARR